MFPLYKSGNGAEKSFIGFIKDIPLDDSSVFTSFIFLF